MSANKLKKMMKYDDDIELSRTGSESSTISDAESETDSSNVDSTSTGSSEDVAEPEIMNKTDSDSDIKETSIGISQQDLQIKKGAWVITQYCLKKSTRCFAGQVIDQTGDGLCVKLLRRNTSTGASGCASGTATKTIFK